MTFYEWCIKNKKETMLQEWDCDKNIYTPDTLSYGSTKSVFWKCNKGHSWKNSPNTRTSNGGSKCPYCANRKVWAGYNDLATRNPEIANEWDYEMNDFLPTEVVEHSNKVAYWKCAQGHHYKTKINERTKKNATGCPYCANLSVLSGYNDLQTMYPELAKEYDTKRNTIAKNEIYGKSTKKVWWICSIGHNYDARILNRAKGTGCPYCAGRKVLFGFNDLQTCFPQIAKEWDFEKNDNMHISPDSIVAGSTKEVWWKCKNGHSWKRRIEVRTNLGTGCPYCAGQRAVEGENDIATKFPDLAKEWDFTLNGDKLPTNTMAGSNWKIHWICPKGHQYIATPNARTSNGQGCPVCAKEKHTSFPEQAIFFYLNKYFDVINRYIDGKIELDIYIPSIKMAIEYDGIYYHRGKEAEKRESRKNAYCKEKYIDLYHIKETNKQQKNKNNIIYRVVPEKGELLDSIITEILNIASKKTGKKIYCDINTNRDRDKIWEQYIVQEKENSLQALYPNIAAEWDYDLNGVLLPSQVSCGSHKRIHWVCSKGHRYENSIKNRVNGNRCPYCANKKVLVGYNDFKSCNPQIAKEWDYTKNGVIQPTNYTSYSGKKVYWICPQGHSYQAKISKRTLGQGCPYCSNKKVLKGYNDIATTNPESLVDWNYEKNVLEPTMLTAGSQKKVFWKCNLCGYEWESTPYLCVYRGFGCANCRAKLKQNGARENSSVSDEGAKMG